MLISPDSQFNQASEQLRASQLEARALGEQVGQSSGQTPAAASVLTQLQSELAAEVAKTQDLLAQAEWLVLQSSAEDGEGEGEFSWKWNQIMTQ